MSALQLLHARHQLSEQEHKILTRACRDVLEQYRRSVTNGDPSSILASQARQAFLYLGGDPARSNDQLADYDHVAYGPFLGVSDEGSAAAAIRDAAFASPKARALPKDVPVTPLITGVAVDAERLGGIGEVAVGPEEYADVWLAAVDRVLMTTNIGTRVNVRVYRREPRVFLRKDGRAAIEMAKEQLTKAFRPFVETVDRRPRPLTVFIEFADSNRLPVARKLSALRKLVLFVNSGNAAGKKHAPAGHALGLVASVTGGLNGKRRALKAIDLAAAAGIRHLILDGARRRAADKAISLAGLLDYFAPRIVGPLLRAAKMCNVELRVAHLPDTDTIARGVWAGLTAARSMGANLGKYGCFPLTQAEINHVVEQVQRWMTSWSAAPVFFVDQGLLRDEAVDVGRDLPRGIEIWLETVAAHGVRVVLIDTIDKATGRRLLKATAGDRKGFLTLEQVERIETHARRLPLKVLWAGGLGMRESYEMGRRGVFGIYVTSAAATTVPVSGVYVRDPALAGVKEPTKEAVLRVKCLLEAGFLSSRLPDERAAIIRQAAEHLLTALNDGKPGPALEATTVLANACESGWHDYWKDTPPWHT